MTEDIKPEVIKKTQDALGKYIKKPVLTEKLLRKPPFRFLHDICTSAMRETGFLEGVLSPTEVKADNIKDKDGKIAFLQKVIAAVEAANGIKLTIRPNKVVAGHEPTRTNEFLQALGKALEKQLENGNATKAAQQPKSKSKTTTKRATKDEPQNKKKSTTTINKQAKLQKPIENGVDESEVKTKSNHKSVSPTKNSNRRTENNLPPDGQNHLHESPVKEKKEEKIRQNGYTEDNEYNDHARNERSRSSHKRIQDIGAGENIDSKDGNAVQIGGNDGQGDQNSPNEVEPNREAEGERPQSARPRQRKPSAQNSTDRTKPNEFTLNGETEHATNGRQEATLDRVLGDKVQTLNRSDSVLGDRIKTSPSPPVVPQSLTKKETSAPKDGSIVSRPRTGIRPATSRPASARPAAPRIRDRGEVAVQEEVIKPVSGKVNVITEKDTNNEQDEDENLVSLESANDILLAEEPAPVPIITPDRKGEHGHLVEQILEAQKELEDDRRLPFSDRKVPGKVEIEWESGRNRESTNREVERLRSSIQTLTRSANPLGKLLDFLQEDIDTMQRELDNWKEMNATLCAQIAQERSLTEQSIEPLKIHLRELQQSIDQQLEQISVVKANIIRNDQKIHKLITGM